MKVLLGQSVITAGKPKSTNNSSKELASVDNTGLQNIKMVMPHQLWKTCLCFEKMYAILKISSKYLTQI